MLGASGAQNNNWVSNTYGVRPALHSAYKKIGSSSIRTIDKQFAGSRYEMKGLVVQPLKKRQNKPDLFVTAMTFTK